MTEVAPLTDVDWLRNLKEPERQAMRERAAHLDRLPAVGDLTGSVRVAFLFTEVERGLFEAAIAAYNLAGQGHMVWLYTNGALPPGLPAEFMARVRHINPDPARPLVEQLPPAELFVTTDPALLPALYRAQRTAVYWHQPGTLVPEGYAALPARIWKTGAAGITLERRPVFPVAPGAQGWAAALLAAKAVAERDPFRALRPRISLCMIVKNEEKHLLNCLLSAYGVVDEICIVDTGSTDRTVQIAERLATRVEHRPWRDDFAWARNEALALATGDWILHLDADEVLTPEARQAIPELVRQSGYAGFLLPLDSVIPSGVSRSYVLRLFRRSPQIYYTGRIHEQVGTTISKAGGKVFAATCPIRHFGYTEDPMRATGKRTRNRDLLLKAIAEEPESPWFHFYLAVEEYLGGAPGEALRLLEKEVPYTRDWVEGEPASLAITCHRLMGQIREALRVARETVSTYPHVLNLWVAMADLAFGLGEEDLLQEALRALGRTEAPWLGDQAHAARHYHLLLGLLADDSTEREAQLRQALPDPAAARALMRGWVRTEGMVAAIRKTAELGLADGFAILLQALVDLQEWPSLATMLEVRPELRSTPAAGSLYLAQGRPDEALRSWQQSGPEGWRRYAATVALFGGEQMALVAEPHLTPLEWLAVKDVLSGEVTWRWALLVAPVCNIGNAHLLDQLVSRAPFLAEAVTFHMRLNNLK
jgi:tetratricopeptide (TPR) repeat protein